MTWELDKFCNCGHCRGGKNKHTWSFFYYLKRMGDEPLVHVYGDKIVITTERGESNG